jgi:uncharacterized membrane protein
VHARERSPPPLYRQPALWLSLLVACYTLFFSLLTVQRHHAQLTTANDLGIFDQLLWNITHGRGMQRSIEISFPHWGVHTQPILYLLAPFYLLFPGPEILLILQSLALALGAVPLYLFARRRIHRAGPALLLAAAYLLSPALQGMNLIDFHPYALAPLFLLWAFYFLETSRSKPFALFALLAIACKEDVAPIVAMMGLYALVIKRRPALGLPTLGFGLAWYLFAVGVWQPHVSGGVDKQGWRYAQLAWPLPELLRTLLTRPGVWIPYVLQPAKRAYLIGLLWPFGLLPLLAPHISALALPPLMTNLLSSFAAQHEPDLYQYNAAIVPFLALASASALAWLRHRYGNWWRGRVVVGAPIALLVVGSLSFQFLYGHSPLAASFHWPQVTVHHAVRDGLLQQIPPDAPVSAQTTLVPHLSGRAAVWEYPMGLDAAEYVILDVTAPHYTIMLTSDYYASIEQLGASDWGLLAAQDGYLLFKRGAAPAALPDGFYSYALSAGPGPAAIQPLDFGPVRLVGVEVTTAREGWVDLTLTWQADEPVPAGYRPSMALGYRDGSLTAWHRQDLPFRWESRGWAPGERLRLTTGVSTGHGSSAGWDTDWILYAGVIDDGSGAWVEPAGVATTPETIDGRDAYLVPVARLRNRWGVLRTIGLAE